MPTVTLHPPHDPDHVSSFLNIRVADIHARLPPCAAFPGLRARPDGPDTVLCGWCLIRRTCTGVLAEIEALGLVLPEVRRVPTE
jgi:hypothetical protein